MAEGLVNCPWAFVCKKYEHDPEREMCKHYDHIKHECRLGLMERPPLE